MPMIAVSVPRALSDVCRSRGKWGMYISGGWAGEKGELHEMDEMVKAAPYLTLMEHGQVICDGYGFLLFDTRQEMLDCYNATRGDDGPTKTNPYDGPYYVYALTCDPSGQLMNENT